MGKVLLAYCTSCGSPQGIYDGESELRVCIAKKMKCENCGALFQFLRDKRIWNLEWDVEEIDLMKDKKELESFWKLTHPNIMKTSCKLFEDGHYPQAVFESFKAVNNRVKSIVKKKTGKELDGRALMFKAFSEKKPIIVLDDLSTETGLNIQEGYKFIFGGSMQGIRNPKAHEEIKISDRRAEHFLILASLLMDKLDERGYP